MFVGHSAAGKGTSCRLLADVTSLRFAGTTSDYLAKYVADRLGVTVEQAYRTRHANGGVWHKVANEVRQRPGSEEGQDDGSGGPLRPEWSP